MVEFFPLRPTRTTLSHIFALRKTETKWTLDFFIQLLSGLFLSSFPRGTRLYSTVLRVRPTFLTTRYGIVRRVESSPLLTPRIRSKFPSIPDTTFVTSTKTEDEHSVFPFTGLDERSDRLVPLHRVCPRTTQPSSHTISFSYSLTKDT